MPRLALATRPHCLTAFLFAATAVVVAGAEPALARAPLRTPSWAPPARTATKGRKAPPAANPTTAATKTAEAKTRVSLPLYSQREGWRRLGLRIGLAASYGGFFGLDGAPSGHLVGGNLRVGVRLDARWSLYASFHYQVALSSDASGGLAGLRYSGTLEPTWHVTDGLSLAFGLGFGGIVESQTTRPDAEPLPSTLATSYTFPDAKTPMQRCSGVGLAGLLRAEYRWQLGRHSSTGPALEATAQWTGCVVETGADEPDTAEAIVRRQWWPHIGLSLSWVVVWR